MLHATNRRSTRRGFTLMELLVVLAILVLLVAMVAPRILGTQKKADVNAAKAQIGLFKGALERYALDMKDFPTTEQGLRALCEKPSDEGTSSDAGSRSDSRSDNRSDSRSDSRSDNAGDGEKSASDKWDGPYLNSSSLPKDPWGHEYQYDYPPTRGKGDYPDIWSYGADGQDDTEDDVVSWTESQKDSGAGRSDREPTRESRSSSPSPSPSSRETAPK